MDEREKLEEQIRLGNKLFENWFGTLDEEQQESVNRVVAHVIDGIDKYDLNIIPYEFVKRFVGISKTQLEILSKLLVKYDFIDEADIILFERMFVPNKFFEYDVWIPSARAKWKGENIDLDNLINFLKSAGIKSTSTYKALTNYIEWSDGSVINKDNLRRQEKTIGSLKMEKLIDELKLAIPPLKK
jgi:hypothetical protein